MCSLAILNDIAMIEHFSLKGALVKSEAPLWVQMERVRKSKWLGHKYIRKSRSRSWKNVKSLLKRRHSWVCSLCSKKSSIMRPRTLSSFIPSSPRAPVLQRAHHTRTRYLLHVWSIWQPWVDFPFVSKIQVAFSSLSVRALPKRKSKTTF